jgi:hypothetical protein
MAGERCDALSVEMLSTDAIVCSNNLESAVT